MIGWAKPTPVDPRNFKNPVLDDILTSVVGPISNFVVAIGAVLILAVVKLLRPGGAANRLRTLRVHRTETDSFLVPLCLLLYELMIINVVLGVFNLIPVPPLDGSHVVRHLLPAGALRVYDMVGMFGLLLLVFWGGRLLSQLIIPAIGFFILHPPENLMTSRSNQRKRVLSGMRSTGKLHLGNFVGALDNWVRMQDQYDCFFFVADWHALTTDYADTSRSKKTRWKFCSTGWPPGSIPSAAPCLSSRTFRSMPNCICCFR